MTSFQSYRGTPYQRWLLPIIPVGATLSEKSRITPENIGKIPGLRWPSGWSGFADWSKARIDKDRVLVAWDAWYPKDHWTIGLQSERFPGIDLDVEERWQAELARDVAFTVLGETIVRGREGSPRELLMYRLAQEPRWVVKHRREYGDTTPLFAIEVLGKGQQYLIQGDHPKGGRYVWRNSAGETAESCLELPAFGFEQIPKIDPDQLPEFIAKLDEAYSFMGLKPQRPRQLRGGDTGGGPGASLIGPEHPELCGDRAELIKALGFLHVIDPEFEGYDAWECLCRALKTAAGGDEDFYDAVYLPWQLENPDNDENYIRAKWESHTDSKVGWTYVEQLAAQRGYVPSAQGLFEALDDDADALAAGAKPERVGTSNDAIDGSRSSQSPAGLPAGQGPGGPLWQADDERHIAEQFVSKYARKNWIYVPLSRTGGEWREFVDGVWQQSFSAPYAVGAECAEIGRAMRAIAGQGNQAALARARYMMSAHVADAVTRIVRGAPKMTVRRDELDRHSWLIGVPGGYVDRGTAVHEPDPSLLITKRAGVAPDAAYPCPRWEAMIWHLCNNTPEQYMAMRSALGYTMSGTGQEQKFFFLHGNAGKEGKTSFLTCLGRVLGDYTTVLPDNTFVVGARESRFAFGSLEGAWFAYRGEVEQGEEWAIAQLKEKTGSGKTTIERKGVDSFSVNIRHALWLQGNHLPHFRKPDTALRRRMVIFECNEELPADARNIDWADEVFRAEGPGIMAWLLDCRDEYRVHGLYLPASIVAKRDEELNSQDQIRLFVNSTYEFDPSSVLGSHEIYSQWRAWRMAEGLGERQIQSCNAFMRDFVKHEICRQHHLIHTRDREDGIRIRVIKGLKIRENSDEDE